VSKLDEAMAKNDASTRSAASWKKSAHHGAGEWISERLTSLALIPLTFWAAWAAFTVTGGGIPAAEAFVRAPVNALLLSLTVVIAIWHMYMGLKVIIEDYMAKPGGRGVLVFLTFLLSVVLLVACLGSIYMIYHGGRV